MAGIIWLACCPMSGVAPARMFIENLLRDSEPAADTNARKLSGAGGPSSKWRLRVSDTSPREMDKNSTEALKPEVEAENFVERSDKAKRFFWRRRRRPMARRAQQAADPSDRAASRDNDDEAQWISR